MTKFYNFILERNQIANKLTTTICQINHATKSALTATQAAREIHEIPLKIHANFAFIILSKTTYQAT